MKRWLPLATILLFGCAISREALDTPRAAVDAFLAALVNADEAALAATLADDASVFMPFQSMPQRLEGKSAVREAFARFFADVQRESAGPPYFHLDPRELRVQRYGDAAIVTFHLGELPAADATTPVMYSRRTFVVVRTGRGWRIAHLHASNVRIEPKSE